MTSVIRILTIDDHPILRDGLSAILSAQPDMTVVAEAENGAEAIALHRNFRPDVALMDLRMPDMDGIEALTRIRAESPSAKIIMLTTYPGDVNAARAISAGAAGYLLKSALRKELVDTIRAVHAGGRRIEPAIAEQLALHCADDPLSARELDILIGVAEGRANKEIGWQLGISEETVKTHLKNIFSKLNVADRTRAVTLALERGII